MGDMVESSEHRHMSIRALALHAQRVGRVFAHPVTWGRLIRERGWRRPRLRVYPAKPKIGIRASRPLGISFTPIDARKAAIRLNAVLLSEDKSLRIDFMPGSEPNADAEIQEAAVPLPTKWGSGVHDDAVSL